ncbi:hypothetical protein, partial [Brucella anthropi]|uniref:hypothetical protein n=1 Tax=Brucella anthropi TaxID=529 RepID=UPI0021588928
GKHEAASNVSTDLSCGNTWTTSDFEYAKPLLQRKGVHKIGDPRRNSSGHLGVLRQICFHRHSFW